MNSDPVILLLAAVIVLVGVLVAVVLRGQKTKGGDQSLALLQSQIAELTRTLDNRLTKSSEQVNESVRHQFTESQRLIQDTNQQMLKHLIEVTQGVTEVREAGKQVFTIAEQLKNLERVLTHQKQRGSLGEEGLKLVLDNLLPATGYELQYHFQNGDAVDAIIKTKDGLIPVDAKFSLDNYSRLTNAVDIKEIEVLEREFKNDLKKRIDETAKYIRPNEGTLPFAFMFIPAEGIFYDLLVGKVGQAKISERSLIDYAYREKNVIIVSPTTFAAYLQSVLYGFRAFQIEESAKGIRKNVEALGKHLRSYDEYFKKLGNSLGTTVNHYNTAQKELGKIDKDVYRITGESIDMEEIAVDQPLKIDATA